MAVDLLRKVLEEIRGTGEPEAPYTDETGGIYHDITLKETDDDGVTPRLAPGMYGSMQVMYDNVGPLVDAANEVAELSNRVTEIDSLYADKATLDSIYADKATIDSVHANKANIDAVVTDIIPDLPEILLADDRAAAAALSESNAADSEATVLAAEAAMTDLFDSFDDRYLGVKASDPTLDNDGDPLLSGSIYYNTTDSEVKFYNGASWDAPSASSLTSATNAANSAAAALVSEGLADDDAAQTALDRVATGNDLTATNADVVTTNADVVLTHADVVSTNQDTIDTAANLVATNQDTIDTAADRVQTGNDVITTGNNVTAAQTAQGLAEDARNAAAISADFVDDLFLGAKASDPTTDNDGGVLQTGAMYYNTAANPKQIMIWDGAAWAVAVFDGSGTVVTFNGRDGAVVLTAADINAALGFTAIELTKANVDTLGINATTVNSLTVETAVPVGAVFTDNDTTYSPATPGTNGTDGIDGLLEDSDKYKLDNIEVGATADQTGAEIKAAYENNLDTNAYTDAEQTKVSHIAVTQAVNLDTIESDTATNNTKITNVTTDLSNTASTTEVTVKSSDGTDTSIAAASTLVAGVMTKAMYDEHVVNNAKETNVTTDLTLGTNTGTTLGVNSSDGTDVVLPAAATGVAGLLSGDDKDKLDGVATSANNYSHPTGDGNLHVPATSTTNNGKVLTAGSTAGSLSWETSSIGDLVSTNNLNDVANVVTSRSNLGLVIGTDVLSPSGDGSQLTGITVSEETAIEMAIALG